MGHIFNKVPLLGGFMKKSKLIRTIGFIMLFVYILNTFVGCAVSKNNGLSYEQKFIEQLKRDFMIEEKSSIITAKPFAQQISLSAVFSLEIKIVEGNIFIRDCLYNRIDYIDSREISFGDTAFIGVRSETTDEEYSEIIEKIKNTDNCYMLETDDAKSVSKRVAVYVIDGTYYFLSVINDNEVLRIHYADC